MPDPTSPEPDLTKESGAGAGDAPTPIRFPELKLAGFSMDTAAKGEVAEILVRYGTTSDQHFFHVLVKGFAGVLRHELAKIGAAANIEAAGLVLVHIHADDTADLWVDQVEVEMSARLKRSVEKGDPIYEDAILDVVATRFPGLVFSNQDRVIVLFREGWRFGLYFDLSGEFDQAYMEATLARLYRTMLFFERYAALGEASVSASLTNEGWFPFLELHNDEFRSLYNAVLEARDLGRCNKVIVGNFDAGRIDALGGRWMSNPHFAKREVVLRSGLESYKRADPVAAIKTLLTELEGILQDGHIAVHSTNAKTGALLKFAGLAGAQKAGATDTLFFPTEFQGYLESNMFRDFDPLIGDAIASRHGAAHGAAPPDAYTQVRALQVVLTLDQICHYLS
ncbi:hypothetical protein [Caulobacter hibisci]|uniref:Uncharacterized protein n=1 Tax=Caulobacter hibisci TaxID=2035993 RepID=A0ABS0T029_9CAUL|nr:hypothetical protein [Caulobacter hibisci]MBI1685223.1 hypothetical protein [Caulobacter hibisci]